MRYLYLILFFIFLSCSLPKIVILDDPLSPEQHNDLGVAYLKSGNLELAEKEFLKALKHKQWAIPCFNLGNLFYLKKDFDSSERYFKKAIKLDENYAEALNNLAFLFFERGVKLEEALKLVEKAINIEDRPEFIDTKNKILQKLKQKDF